MNLSDSNELFLKIRNRLKSNGFKVLSKSYLYLYKNGSAELEFFIKTNDRKKLQYLFFEDSNADDDIDNDLERESISNLKLNVKDILIDYGMFYFKCYEHLDND